MTESGIDIAMRERDFARARPQLRRLATRLLTTADDIRFVLSEARAHWLTVEGAFDAPTRYLLRLVGHLSLAVHRHSSGYRAGPPGTEPVIAAADEAQVSMLIALTRMPARARRLFLASLLGRKPSCATPEDAALLAGARLEIEAVRPDLSNSVIEPGWRAPARLLVGTEVDSAH